ncbi:MAG: hypothetical protein ACOZAI_02605 [Pseudomonadota bacterium]
MDESRSRDDFSANRDVHATELEARFLELVEKSGLSLDQRGMSRPVSCQGRRASGGASITLAAIPGTPGELTLVTGHPLEQGCRIILERSDRQDKDRFVEGVIQHSRRGGRPNDDDSVFVSILKITHGNF